MDRQKKSGQGQSGQGHIDQGNIGQGRINIAPHKNCASSLENK
jgi:hypothetical protein